jgi:hypothetical protein
MSAARNDDVISVGKWWEWPPELWGSRDRAEAAALQGELGRTPSLGPPQRPVPALPPGFTLHPKPSKARDNRGRQVDRLLGRLGLR